MAAAPAPAEAASQAAVSAVETAMVLDCTSLTVARQSCVEFPYLSNVGLPVSRIRPVCPFHTCDFPASQVIPAVPVPAPANRQRPAEAAAIACWAGCQWPAVEAALVLAVLVQIPVAPWAAVQAALAGCQWPAVEAALVLAVLVQIPVAPWAAVEAALAKAAWQVVAAVVAVLGGTSTSPVRQRPVESRQRPADATASSEGRGLTRRCRARSRNTRGIP